MTGNMKNKLNGVLNIIPGFLIALLIAATAKWIESLLPIHLIGASVIALFIGMIINQIKNTENNKKSANTFIVCTDCILSIIEYIMPLTYILKAKIKLNPIIENI